MRRALKNPVNWPFLVYPPRPSWGEAYTSIEKRMLAAIHEAFDSVESGDVVLVSHQLPIWVTHLSVAGESFPHDPRKRRCALSSVTTFERVSEAAPAPQPRPGEEAAPADPSAPPVLRLVEVGYTEPAGSLIATATDVGAV